MGSAKITLLSRLFGRLVTSAVISFIGCWGLIVTRLNLFKERWPELIPLDWMFYVDAASLSLSLLGLMFFLLQARALKWRLRRLDDLGEANW
jgi:hypothetical protein